MGHALSGKDLVRFLRSVGHVEVRQSGSHVSLACDGRSGVSVPLHAELKKGTLRGILKDAGLTIKDLDAFLGR